MIDEVRLYMFDGGSTYLPLRNVNLGQGGDGEMITTPTIWFAITHPRGHVVIDGGNAPEVAVDAAKHWGAITPADVRWIVQSHLHLDHTGAVAEIQHSPNAEVLVTRTEYEWAHAPDSYADLGYIRADYVKPDVPWVML